MHKIVIKKNIFLAFFCIVFFIIVIFIMCINSKKSDFIISNNEEENILFDDTNNTKENVDSKKNTDIGKEENCIYVHIIGEVNNAGLIKLEERCKNN